MRMLNKIACYHLVHLLIFFSCFHSLSTSMLKSVENIDGEHSHQKQRIPKSYS